MKQEFKISLSIFTLLALAACTNRNTQTPTPVPPGPDLRGVFAGMTPCTTLARPLLQIPEETDCEQIIWNLVLRQDPQTSAPTIYSLEASYGMSKQGTNDLAGGGTSISMEGDWRITTGTKNDPDAVVYQLDPNDPQKTISFLRISDDLIHVLDGEKAMLVGNGAWSYTLDRMDNQGQAQAHEPAESLPDLPTRPPQPPVPAGSSVFGVFDGRTPCHEAALAFTGTTSPGCVKIKWRLTLYQDSATGEPSRYLFMSTSAYREGSWKIVHGMDGDPNGILYQLQPNGTQQTFSFLKVDDNHLFLMDGAMNLLVGNELFSYTLSRKMEGVP